MRRIALVLFQGLLVAGCAAPVAVPVPEAVVSDAPVTPVARPSAGVATELTTGSDRIPQGSFLFYEDFEHGFDKWELPPVAAGAIGLRPLNAFSCGGLWSVLLGTEKNEPYQPVAATYTLALKAPIDLKTAVHPFLKFDVKGQTTPAETIDATAEVRGADGVWKPVGRKLQGTYVFVASIGADLTAYAGQAIDLRFRVTMKAADAKTSGFYFDDIQVLEPNTK